MYKWRHTVYDNGLQQFECSNCQTHNFTQPAARQHARLCLGQCDEIGHNGNQCRDTFMHDGAHHDYKGHSWIYDYSEDKYLFAAIDRMNHDLDEWLDEHQEASQIARPR